MSLDLARPISTILAELGDRVTAAEAATAASTHLTADAISYLSTTAAGALIAALSQPYGPGTTYEVVGVAPPQLALASGHIVAGTGLVGNATRKVMIRAIAADGTRQIAETLSFSEVYAAPAPTPTPTPNPSLTPTVSFTVANISHLEGNTGTTTYQFPVTRVLNGAASTAITAPVTFALGSGLASDFVGGLPTGLVASFASGQLSTTVTLLVQGDGMLEQDEMFSLSLVAPAGYIVGDIGSATGSIINDDAAPVQGTALTARPAPDEPQPQSTTSNYGSGTLNSGSANHYVDGTMNGDMAWVINFGMADASNADGYRYKQRNGTHAALCSVVGNVETQLGGHTYFDTPDTSQPIRYRVERVGETAKLFFAAIGQPFADPVDNYTGGLPGSGTFAGTRSDFAANFTNTDIGVIGLANDPLIVAPAVNAATGQVNLTVDYFMPADAVLEMQYTDLGGNPLTSFQPAIVIENATAGHAVLQGADLAPANKQGATFKVVLRSQADHTLIDTSTAFYGAPVEIGQNVNGLSRADRTRQVYTNLLYGSHQQGGDNMGADAYAYFENLNYPTKIDPFGNPLVNGMDYHHQLPSRGDGVKTRRLSLKWTGGDISVSTRQDKPGTTYGPMTRVGPNEIQYDITWDYQAQSQVVWGTLRFDTLTPGSEPKNLSLSVVGEDLNQRFTTDFLNYMRQFPGFIRNMEGFKTNAYMEYFETRCAWQYRAKRNVIGAQIWDTPYEDIAEIAWETNRPIYFTIPACMAYAPEGPDTLHKIVRLMVYGEGSDTPNRFLRAGKRFGSEFGNEGWNKGLPTYLYTAKKAKESGRYPNYNMAPGANDYQGELQASCYERMYQQPIAMQIVMDAIGANWRNVLTRYVSQQMSYGNLGNLAAQPTWAAALSFIDKSVIAPYCPLDPTAGGSSGQPASHSVTDVFDWLTDRLDNTIRPLVRQLIAEAINLIGASPDIYEVGMTLSAIANTKKAEQYAIRSSQRNYDWHRDHFLPFIFNEVGGRICIFKDTEMVGGNDVDGSNSNRFGWEDEPNGTANKASEALLDYMAAHAQAA